MFRGEGQLFLIRLLRETGVPNRGYADTARAKSRDEIAVHGVFVDVDLDLAHEWRSALVLLFEGLCFLRLGFQVRVDFRLVGMVVGKGRMNLS